MKKILYSLFAMALVLPMSVSAATFSFAPVTGTFVPGETFSAIVYVNPIAGEKITTAKLSATFPTSLVEVVSFTQATGWIPLAAPGSDLIDNTNGKLLKTGGFPSRVTGSKQFGTLIFRAKAAGTALVSIAGDSMLLDTTNANKYVTSPGTSFTIVKSIPTTPKSTPKKPAVTAAPTVKKVSEDTEKVTNTGKEVVTTPEKQKQLAAIAESGSFSTTTKTVTVLLGLLAFLILGFFLWKRRRSE